MTNNEIDTILGKFISQFNAMCRSERKDFLLRERTVNYESSSSVKTYYINYEMKRYNNTWKIYGVSENGFWIFKKKFPLLDLVKSQDKIIFKGLYTSTIPTATADNFQECLDKYIEVCKGLPQNVFINT